MSDAKVAAMQRHAAEAEVERLRLVGELEEMRVRAEKAEAQLASITGVTRLELVAAEWARCAAIANDAAKVLAARGKTEGVDVAMSIRRGIESVEAAP